MNEPMTEEEIAEARALLDADGVDPIEWAERAPRLVAEIERLRAENERLAREDSRAAAAVEVYMERAAVATDDVGPPEEPMPAVAIAGERCEYCWAHVRRG